MTGDQMHSGTCWHRPGNGQLCFKWCVSYFCHMQSSEWHAVCYDFQASRLGAVLVIHTFCFVWYLYGTFPWIYGYRIVEVYMWIRWHTCVTVGTEIYNGNLSRLLEADVMLIQHPAIINTFSKMWMYVSCPEMVNCTCINTLMILCAGEIFSVPCGKVKRNILLALELNDWCDLQQIDV